MLFHVLPTLGIHHPDQTGSTSPVPKGITASPGLYKPYPSKPRLLDSRTPRCTDNAGKNHPDRKGIFAMPCVSWPHGNGTFQAIP